MALTYISGPKDSAPPSDSYPTDSDVGAKLGYHKNNNSSIAAPATPARSRRARKRGKGKGKNTNFGT
jgi:hypothetical protein